MAIVDANYNFIYADVGSQGRISDGGVFRKTEFYSKLQNNKLNLPPDDVLPGSQETAPYVFLADDAFPLQKHIMKPYSGSHEKNSPKRIYNYRVSRARRVVENTFGIMSSVFRILRKPILLKPQHATTVILSCVYLHNFLRKYSISYASNTPINADEGNNSGSTDNEPMSSFIPLRSIGRRASNTAENFRHIFTHYVNNVDELSWQRFVN